MKKKLAVKRDELRPEYDLSQLGRGVRGKYYRRLMAGTNLVLIDPDLVTVFPNGEAVNRALRVIAEAGRAANRSKNAPKRSNRTRTDIPLRTK